MIKLTTDCETCSHKNVCQYKDNAKSDMNKLKDTRYGTGPNDDYNWETMSSHRHVNVTFSCSDYRNGINRN